MDIKGTLPVKCFFHKLPTFREIKIIPSKRKFIVQIIMFRFDSVIFGGVKKTARLLLRLQLGHLHPSLNDVQIESTLVNMGG